MSEPPTRGPPMYPAAFVKQLCREWPKEVFEQKFPHPWLVRELTDGERSAISISSFTDIRTTAYHTAPLWPWTSFPPSRLGARLLRDYYRLGLHPVAKERIAC